MRPISIINQLDADDPDGICLEQTTVAAGVLAINGAFASAGVATLDAQRKVLFTSTSDLSAVTITITGTDNQNRPISESLAGPNAGTVSSVLDYLTVTQIATSDAWDDGTVGTSGVGASQPVPLDQYISPFNVSLSVGITDTTDVTAQFTFDDIFDGFGPFDWTNHTDLTNVVADANGTLISPVTACRLLTNSGVGTAVLRILQAGLT